MKSQEHVTHSQQLNLKINHMLTFLAKGLEAVVMTMLTKAKENMLIVGDRKSQSIHRQYNKEVLAYLKTDLNKMTRERNCRSKIDLEIL